MPTLHLVRPPVGSCNAHRFHATADNDTCARTGDADLLRLRSMLATQANADCVIALGPLGATQYLDALGVPWTHRVVPPAGAVWCVQRTLRRIARQTGCESICIHGPGVRASLHRLPAILHLRSAPPLEATADLGDSSTPAADHPEPCDGVRTLLTIDQPASIIDARRFTFLCGLMTVAGVPTRPVIHASAARIATARRFAAHSNIPTPVITDAPPATLLNHVDALVSDVALVRVPQQYRVADAEALCARSTRPCCVGHTLDWSALHSDVPTARLPRLAGALLDAVQEPTMMEPAAP